MNDGGPAYPVNSQGSISHHQFFSAGMSMLDFFAAHALTGEMASFSTQVSAEACVKSADKCGHSIEAHIAANAYAIAAAMLAEKNRLAEGKS